MDVLYIFKYNVYSNSKSLEKSTLFTMFKLHTH